MKDSTGNSIKNYVPEFGSDIIEYDIFKFSESHRKFDAFIRRFWGDYHPLTRDIINSFISELKTTSAKIIELEELIDELHYSIQELKNENDSKKENLNKLLVQLEGELEDKLTATESQMAKIIEENRDLSAVNQELKEENKEYSVKLKQVINQVHTLEDKLETQEKIRVNQKNQLKELLTQKSDFEKQDFNEMELQKQLDDKNDIINDLTLKIEELKSENAELNEKTNYLENLLELKPKRPKSLRKNVPDFNKGHLRFEEAQKIKAQLKTLQEVQDDISNSVSDTEELESIDKLEQMMSQNQSAEKELKPDTIASLMGDGTDNSPIEFFSNYIVKEKSSDVNDHDLRMFFEKASKSQSEVLKNIGLWGLNQLNYDFIEALAFREQEIKQLKEDLEKVKRENILDKINLQSEIAQLRRRTLIK